MDLMGAMAASFPSKEEVPCTLASFKRIGNFNLNKVMELKLLAAPTIEDIAYCQNIGEVPCKSMFLVHCWDIKEQEPVEHHIIIKLGILAARLNTFAEAIINIHQSIVKALCIFKPIV